MKLTINSYATILIIQLLLLLIDLSINTFIGYVRKYTTYQLIIFIVQDICIILALTTMFLTFFSTYVFQAGLIELLYDRFRATIIATMFYLILTIILQVWSLSVRWKAPLEYKWSTSFHVFYIFQRFTSVIYYYLFKRSALRISDPRFYDSMQYLEDRHLVN